MTWTTSELAIGKPLPPGTWDMSTGEFTPGPAPAPDWAEEAARQIHRAHLNWYRENVRSDAVGFSTIGGPQMTSIIRAAAKPLEEELKAWKGRTEDCIDILDGIRTILGVSDAESVTAAASRLQARVAELEADLAPARANLDAEMGEVSKWIARYEAEYAQVESLTAERDDRRKALDRVAELETERKRDEEYDARVPDPRKHKYLDMECAESGCKSLLLGNRIQELTAERDRLREALREVGEFAAAHHGDQPLHVLLHGLTVDVPERCKVALDKLVAEPAVHVEVTQGAMEVIPQPVASGDAGPAHGNSPASSSDTPGAAGHWVGTVRATPEQLAELRQEAEPPDAIRVSDEWTAGGGRRAMEYLAESLDPCEPEDSAIVRAALRHIDRQAARIAAMQPVVEAAREFVSVDKQYEITGSGEVYQRILAVRKKARAAVATYEKSLAAALPAKEVRR